MPDRRNRNRLTRRLGVFGPALIVMITGSLSLGALRHAIDTRDLVIHTRDVLDAASSLYSAVLEAEAAQRGFVIAGDSAFLRPYRRASERADSMITRLRQLTGDNPSQAVRLDSLALRTHERLALMDTSIADATLGKFDIAGSIAMHRPGQRVLADIRRLVLAVEGSEERLLARRERDEQRATAVATLLIVTGTLIAAVLAFLVNRYLDRALLERRLAFGEAQTVNEQLKQQAIQLEAQATAARSAALEAAQATGQAQVAQLAAEESERRAERLQAATAAFGGTLSLMEVANLIIDQAVSALNGDSGALASLTQRGDALEFVAVRNVSASRVGQVVSLNEDFPMCAAARGGVPVLLASVDEVRQRFPRILGAHTPDGVQAIAALPLENRGRVLGALLLRWKTPRVLSPLDVSFMVALSRIAAEAFDRARLFEAEREARTAAEAANRAKAAFLASMSHELRTPLQAALGFAQLVHSGVYGPINERQGEALGRVERSQMHLARLIDDILDFARLEAGRVRVRVEAVRLTDVIGELAPLVEPLAAAKNIRLSLERADSLRVMADRQRLQQVLVNLVGNAIKFTPEGGTVRVTAKRDSGQVAIQVSDTGPGIPADRLNAIFEPFVQVDSALTREQSGAGLGLAISKDLTRAMRGDLTVESELGIGSTFSVKLQLADD
jgi:signal transduction histidine kinase/CHASE3 domain sensor protein